MNMNVKKGLSLLVIVALMIGIMPIGFAAGTVDIGFKAGPNGSVTGGT